MRLLVTLLLFCGTAVMAEVERIQFGCQFVIECVDTEPCAETDYSLTFDFPALLYGDTRGVMPANIEAWQAIVATDAETFEARAWDAAGGDIIGWTHRNTDGHLWHLSLNAEYARYSVQLPAWETAIYYEGQCTEAPS